MWTNQSFPTCGQIEKSKKFAPTRGGWESLEGHPSPEDDLASALLPVQLQLFYEKELIAR